MEDVRGSGNPKKPQTGKTSWAWWVQTIALMSLAFLVGSGLIAWIAFVVYMLAAHCRGGC